MILGSTVWPFRNTVIGRLLTLAGSDGVGDDDRLLQAFLYMRDPANPGEVDSNHYAFPLPIVCTYVYLNIKLIAKFARATQSGAASSHLQYDMLNFTIFSHP